MHTQAKIDVVQRDLLLAFLTNDVPKKIFKSGDGLPVPAAAPVQPVLSESGLKTGHLNGFHTSGNLTALVTFTESGRPEPRALAR